VVLKDQIVVSLNASKSIGAGLTVEHFEEIGERTGDEKSSLSPDL
jgi:hypothetical protein